MGECCISVFVMEMRYFSSGKKDNDQELAARKKATWRTETVHGSIDRLWPCLVPTKNQKVFKNLRHIESACGTCMKH
jgi:hypothetical protein